MIFFLNNNKKRKEKMKIGFDPELIGCKIKFRNYEGRILYGEIIDIKQSIINNLTI